MISGFEFNLPWFFEDDLSDGYLSVCYLGLILNKNNIIDKHFYHDL